MVDDLSCGTRANLLAQVKLHGRDITGPDLEEVFTGHQYDALIHCAAAVSVIRSMHDPDFDRRVNLEGTAAVLDMCPSHGCPKLIFLSSGGAI